MVTFKSKQRKFEGDLQLKFCCKGLYTTEDVKYLSVKIDLNLSCQYLLHDLSIKLNRGANDLLYRMGKYVNLKILRSISLDIFDSHLSYCLFVCAQEL